MWSVLKWSQWRKQKISNLPEIILFTLLYYTYSEITKLKQLGYSLTHTTFALCTPIKLVYFTVHTYLQEPGKGNFTLGEREGDTDSSEL